jgi:chromodomain-helicase-DNA-binding protein 7
LNPQEFDDAQQFVDDFDPKLAASDDEKRLRVSKLHDKLKPYMLHRVKEDVEKSIGAKEETIVEVELTRTQKRLYKMLIEKNVPELLSSGFKSMNNIVMQLRKVCNHPYLLQADGSEIDAAEANADKSVEIIDCCGKMVFVDKLLAKLHPTGAKVLIFSQMTKVLDLLEDFCHYRGYSYTRIDGSVTWLATVSAFSSSCCARERVARA